MSYTVSVCPDAGMRWSVGTTTGSRVKSAATSAVLNVPISRKDWLGYRFATEPHCDLAEQLTFYGVSGREGAARRFNLDFYCKAFGIESPKSHGVTGLDVNTLLAAGKQQEIAEYCLRDVRATVQLYQVWKERLAGIK